MDVNDRNLVNAPGDSDPQVPAVGSEQAGFRRSSSHDRRTSGVDSQAPDSPNATSAANYHPTDEQHKNEPEHEARTVTNTASAAVQEADSIYSSAKILKNSLV